MKCLYCNKEVSDKAKYCSDAHRKAYTRRTKAGQNPDKRDPDIQPGHIEGLTRTDALFETSKPGYYTFTANRWERECFMCDKKFKTSLQLLKVCSPTCQMNMLNKLTV